MCQVYTDCTTDSVDYLLSNGNVTSVKVGCVIGHLLSNCKVLNVSSLCNCPLKMYTDCVISVENQDHLQSTKVTVKCQV